MFPRRNPDDDPLAFAHAVGTTRALGHQITGDPALTLMPSLITMIRAEARTTLNQIRTLTRLEAWIRCAKAELASTPGDQLLAEFIRVNERLLTEEREKLKAA